MRVCVLVLSLREIDRVVCFDRRINDKFQLKINDSNLQCPKTKFIRSCGDPKARQKELTVFLCVIAYSECLLFYSMHESTPTTTSKLIYRPVPVLATPHASS